MALITSKGNEPFYTEYGSEIISVYKSVTGRFERLRNKFKISRRLSIILSYAYELKYFYVPILESRLYFSVSIDIEVEFDYLLVLPSYMFHIGV